jgi:sec-independent protein translocase protein TatC
MKKENIMSFMDHLEELRMRLVKCFIALIIGMGVMWHFSPALLSFVEKPLTGDTYLSEFKTEVYNKARAYFPSIYKRYQLKNDPGTPVKRKLYYSAPLEPFFIQIKLSMIAGTVIAFPIIIYQVWLFAAPGLMPNEKRMTVPIVTAGTVSFCLGGLFFLIVIWPILISFSLSYEAAGLQSWFNLSAYLNFCLRLILIFGLVFELPVVAGVLARIGLIGPQLLAQKRKYAIIASAIVAAFHADLMTMCVVWIPLYLMYELSILVVRILTRRRLNFKEKQEVAF